MVRSLAVIGAMVAVVWFLVPRPTAIPQPAIDVRSTVLAAAEDLGVPGHPAALVEPKVPDGWRSNAASWSPSGPDRSETLHVGYLTAENQYAAVELTQNETPGWLKTMTHEGTKSGTVTLGGRQWETQTSADGRRSLVLRRSATAVGVDPSKGGTVTTVITGTASPSDLNLLATAFVR